MIRFTTLSTVIALAVGTLASSTSAAQPTTQAPHREMRISLADAIALSLQNDPDLAAAGLAPRRAAAEIAQQEGVFMPTLSLFAGIDRDRQPPTFVALGTFRNNVSAEARITGRLRWGTEYNLSYGTTRLESDSQFTPTNPMSSAYVQLQVRQPLLRGFGSDVNRAGITIARGNVKIADAALRRTTEVAVASTVDAYWRLVRAHRSLAVARESLQLAEHLVERTRSRVAAGDLPTIELTQARASVAARQEAVIVGEAEVGNANDSLARLLVVDPRRVFGSTFVPTDEPRAEAAAIDQATLVDEAFHQRGELFAARQQVRNAEVSLGAAHNARKPDLSVVGSVGVGGLGSTWTSAQGQLARDFDDQHRWTAGLVFSVPLDNRAANGGFEKAHLALAEAKLALRSVELQVTEEVRKAIRNLDATAKRVETTRRAAELARDQLAAGEKRLASGMSTAFEVLRLQTDLAAAQHAEIAAVIGYRTSAMRVELATGGLFGRYVTST